MVNWPDGFFFGGGVYIVYVWNIHDWLKEKLGTSNSVYYSLLQDLGSAFNEGTVTDVDCYSPAGMHY